MAKDALGDRMKSQYENRTNYQLPRRTYTIIRLDGRAFHSYTKKFNKPFDRDLMEAMDYTTIKLCEQIHGCQFGYTQSDEISLLLTDFDSDKTEAYFDGKIQKIASVSASTCSVYFNEKIKELVGIKKLATFDSRVFSIPDPIEVYNYFLWRLRDCERNSIMMVAQSIFSHKELQGKNIKVVQEMIYQESGSNWWELDDKLKRGRLISKVRYTKGDVNRSKWESKVMYRLPDEKEEFFNMIPLIEVY